MHVRRLGGMGMPQDEHAHVMHSDLTVYDGVTMMGADSPSAHLGAAQRSRQPQRRRGRHHARLVRRPCWTAATVDAAVQRRPRGATTSASFTDRFGVSWLLNAGTGGS